MQIRPVRLDDVALAPLLDGLTAEYQTRYGEVDEMMTTSVDEFVPPSGLFLAGLVGDTVVAGAGFRRVTTDVCEVKRMWTAPDRRGRGHASAVLKALEDAALTAGYRTVRLETGPAQPEAAALYTAHGYRRIPVYGRYPEALAFERSLIRD